MDLDSDLHRRVQLEPSQGVVGAASEIAASPAALLWYMLQPVDPEGISPEAIEAARLDKETLWLVVDGKHDMDDSEKRKLNVMQFVIESVVANFAFDGMYDAAERNEAYEAYKARFRAEAPSTLAALEALFDSALERINARYDPVRLNKNRVGDIKDALHERFTLSYPFPKRVDPRYPPFRLFSEANTLYPQLSYSDWVADFDASFIRNQPWAGVDKGSFSLSIAATTLTLTREAGIVGRIAWPGRRHIDEIRVVPSREEKEDRAEKVWDSSGFADEMLSLEGVSWEKAPFLERLRAFPRNGRTVDRIVSFVARFGGRLCDSLRPKRKVPNHLIALFIVMKNHSFATKDRYERFDNQRRSRKGNPDTAKSEQKTFWDGMLLDAYISRFFGTNAANRKKHLDFFFDEWYRRTYSSLGAVLQLNERSDLVFGRVRNTSVDLDYDLFLDFVSQIEFVVQGGASGATAGVSAFTADSFRHVRREGESRATVGRAPHLLRDPLGGFKVVCYKSGLSWAQAFCLSFAVAFDNGLRSGDVREALVDAFVGAVYVKSFADKAMGVAAKELHGDPDRLGPGQEPGTGYMWNTSDSTAMIGLLQAKVDLVKLIAARLVRFDRYSGRREKLADLIRSLL